MCSDCHIKPVARRTIAVLAVGAFCLSLWLTVQKLTGKIDTLAGCGTGSGCANVLGSKWSMVFGVIPVSVFSCLLYLAVLASLWLRSQAMPWFRSLAAWLLIGAALWFTALQLFILDQICPYCMTMHGFGVALGVTLLFADKNQAGMLQRARTTLPLAFLLVAGLAAVQYFGPEPPTHRVDDVAIFNRSAAGHNDIRSAGEGRLVSFFDGGKSFRIDTVPHLGSPEAEHVIVEYYDYTCEACRQVHGELEQIINKYPEKLAVIVLPVPLNRSCNPHLPAGVKDNPNACGFARLSLSVWRADPTQFMPFHRWLFEYHELPYDAVEAMAYSLVGAEKMKAVDTKWVDAVLAGNVSDYKEFVKATPVMPKVLLKGSKIIQGTVRDSATLEALLKDELDF